jgi:hypothetical protein
MLNSRFAMEIAAAVFTAALGAIISLGSLRHGISWTPEGPAAGFFPFYIGCLIMLGSLGNLVQATLARRTLLGEFIPRSRIAEVVAFFLSIVAFAVLVALLGLYVGTAIYLSAVTMWKAKLRPLRAALLGVGTAVFLFSSLEYSFNQPLPKGPQLGAVGIY